MILEVLTSLSTWIYGTPAVAISAALLWGVVSVILSPCHLGSIPLVIGFVGAQSCGSKKKAALLSTVFSVGILATIALLGIFTAMAGRMLGDIGHAGTWIGTAVFLLVGLLLLDLISLPQISLKNEDKYRGGSYPASFVMGLLFGTALGPCAFAFLMPVLGFVFGIASTNPLYATALITAYAIGHCGVIIIAGTSSVFAIELLNVNKKSHVFSMLRKVCGVLVLITGVWFFFK